MLRFIEINGREYEVGRNYDVGESIKNDYGEYKLGCVHDGFITKVFFKSNNYFEKDKYRNIGSLIYNTDTDVITYRKYINPEQHIFRTSNRIGLNYDIIQNLAVKDRIVIVERQDTQTVYLMMSVRKALTYQDFKQFKTQGYEKQIFVPVEDFNVKTVPKEKGKNQCAKK